MGAILLTMVLATILLPPGVRAASYAVNEEQPIVGTTTGLPGARVADGAFETLTEADVAPDPSSYPGTQLLATGSQISGSFPAGIQTSDDSWVQYREGATGFTTVINNPGAVGSPCTGFTNSGNGRLSDNAYAASAAGGDQCAYTTFGFSIPAGSTITKVELGDESYGLGNDRWTLTLSWDGGTSWCAGVTTPQLPASDPNSYTFYDFTSCRAWTPAEVNNIASRFTHTVAGTADTDYLDANVARVSYIPPGNYQANIQYNWTGVPAGQNQRLSVEGHIVDENVVVQILTPPSTWNTRLTLNNVTDQTLTYDLTAAEYNGGGPAIRFVDALGSDAIQSDFYLDRIFILTTVLDYRLDVRQNVTGILGVSPVLTVRGSILAGADNYNIYVWNFTAAVWDLRLASPFTTTNAYHNVSLPPQDISGGTVRLRFVDTLTSDPTRDSLNLDLVAVSTVPGNAPPGLANEGAAPGVGNISTSFLFFVRYTDIDNDAPAYVRLGFNNVTYAMVANNSGDTTYTDGKDYHYNLVVGVRGTFNYNFTARAATGNNASEVVSPTHQLQVLNRPPTITNPIAAEAVHMGRRYTRDFNATDLDGDALAWSLSTNATWLAVGSGNGTVWGRAPTLGARYYVNASVADGLGGRAYVNYTLTVGNNPPTITTPPISTSALRGPFTKAMAATDPDGDPLAWSLTTNASSTSINAVTGVITGSGIPPPGGFYYLVMVADGLGGQDSVNFTITFLNRPPDVTGTPVPTITPGAAYDSSLVATDPDGDAVTWSLATNATWLSLDGSGRLAGTAVAGTYYVNVTARDPYGGVASRNYTLVVQATPAVGMGWLYPGLLVGIVGAAVGLGVFLMYRRKPRGDVILKAYLFNDRAVVLQELASDKEDPPVKLVDILKLLPGGKVEGEKWLKLPPYRVAVVREADRNLAAITRSGSSSVALPEARGLLHELVEEERAKPVAPPPKPKAEVKPGHAYLVEEERPVESLGTLEALIRQGKQALVITRTNPRMFRQNYDLRDSKVYWLVDRNEPERGELMPPSLEKIAFLIQEFCHDNPGSVIFIEGLEFLVDNNNFGAVLKLIRRLVDMVSQGDHTLLVSLSPHILQERERRSLEKEMEVLGTEAATRQ